LEYSTRGEDAGCPVFSPKAGVEALHQHCLRSRELAELTDPYLIYCKEVWALIGALWGEPALGSNGKSNYSIQRVRQGGMGSGG